MGLFSRRSEPDIRYLTAMPIQSTVSYPDIEKLAHRLCHLLYRTSNPDGPYQTFMIAKWALQKIPSLGLRAKDMPYVDKLINQIRQNVQGWEARYGVLDTAQFDRMVTFAGYGPERILLHYGSLYCYSQPPYGTPIGDLSQFVSDYAWRQLGFDQTHLY